MSLNEIVLKTRNLLSRLLGEKFELVLELEHDLGMVKIDPAQVQQILFNLVLNARDAMPQGGRIQVTTGHCNLKSVEGTKSHSPGVFLSVKDVGCGMSAETRARLFEPFFTTKVARQRHGAWIVHRPEHRDRQRWERGSRQRTRPGHAGHRVPAASCRCSCRHHQSLSLCIRHGETILLTEDNVAVRQAAVRILSECGYVVLEAASGPEAIAIARDHSGKIDLLLADVDMPGMSGHETALQICVRTAAVESALHVRLRATRAESRGSHSLFQKAIHQFRTARETARDFQTADSTPTEIQEAKAREAMTTAEITLPATPQIEGANFLNILIVDDERSIREACREVAQSLGFNTFVADSAEHAYRLLDSQGIDAVLLDLRLPGAGGLEALNRIKSLRPDAVIVVVTGYGTVQSAVQAMKNGAYDYVTKPFSLDELKLLLDRVASHLKLKSENRILREKIKSKQGFGSIIGRSPEMEKLYRIVAKAAHSTHPVLILGESGTGKELVARSIHFSGPFRDKPFIPVDCGSLVPTLIESELFGHTKGAFTGAHHAKDGLLSIAEGGTVFLDEVGELPTDLQAKLLRAIQEKEIRPVGGTKQIPINVRILAATNRDLEEGVSQGTFRRDLYYRLNVLSLRIPSLRERRQDIPILATHFLERQTRSSGNERTLSDDAMKAMLAYDWPGNVRELENCLERACAFTTGPMIHLGDLPAAISQLQGTECVGDWS